MFLSDVQEYPQRHLLPAFTGKDASVILFIKILRVLCETLCDLCGKNYLSVKTHSQKPRVPSFNSTIFYWL